MEESVGANEEQLAGHVRSGDPEGVRKLQFIVQH